MSRLPRDRREMERRLAGMRGRMYELYRKLPVLDERCRQAAREFDEGRPVAVATALVDAFCGPAPVWPPVPKALPAPPVPPAPPSSMQGRKAMATKDSDPCREKAAPGEPIFTLRAQDRTAPATVRDWARRASALGAPREKVDEAMLLAVEMEAWQAVHGYKTPD